MKKIILAVAVAALALMAVASPAFAGVERYQEQAGVLTVTLPDHGYVHTYAITINPCDGSFSGVSTPANGVLETIEGTLVGNHLTFEALYTGVDYSWSYNGPLAGGTAESSTGQILPVNSALGTLTNTTNYKNHGDYVSQAGDKADAAHSCIGMPIN